ncbi:MAG: pilus assembly protein, partial [bacterium]|nr:pilus assembly protein [bacterium]
FAVVAPLFLLLLAGMVEFGQAFRIEHALANACRRGARAGICDGSTTSAVTGEVKEQCSQSLGVNEADVAVAVKVNGDEFLDLSKAKARDEIAVTVSIPFSDAGAGFFANMFSNSTLSSTTILEHE